MKGWIGNFDLTLLRQSVWLNFNSHLVVRFHENS